MSANPNSPMARRTTYAILQDLSAVVPTADAFGIFDNELEATERLIELLDAEREALMDRLTRARRKTKILRITARSAL